MRILIIGKGAAPEICDYLQHSEFEWSEVVDESQKPFKSWYRLVRELLSAQDKKLVFIGSQPSFGALLAILVARRSAIAFAYSLGAQRQRIAWYLSALVVASGAEEKRLAKQARAKQVLTVRPFLNAAQTRVEAASKVKKPTDSTVFYCDSPAGLEPFLRAIANTSFTALIPRHFLKRGKYRALITGLGLRERVIPLPSKLLSDACLLCDAVVVSHNTTTYPDVFFSAAANSVGWLVAEGSACSRVFNSSIVEFSQSSVVSLTDAMLNFERDKKHLKNTVFIGPKKEAEAIDSLKVLFDYVA